MNSKQPQKSKAQLIVEKSEGQLWGRVKIRGNLIYDYASSLASLEKKLKELILDFENVEITEFEVSYDLTSFFEDHKYLNISEIATKAGISLVLMRQYSSGAKFPSEERVKQIENAIKEIGKALTKVRLHKPVKEYA